MLVFGICAWNCPSLPHTHTRWIYNMQMNRKKSLYNIPELSLWSLLSARQIKSLHERSRVHLPGHLQSIQALHVADSFGHNLTRLHGGHLPAGLRQVAEFTEPCLRGRKIEEVVRFPQDSRSLCLCIRNAWCIHERDSPSCWKSSIWGVGRKEKVETNQMACINTRTFLLLRSCGDSQDGERTETGKLTLNKLHVSPAGTPAKPIALHECLRSLLNEASHVVNYSSSFHVWWHWNWVTKSQNRQNRMMAPDGWGGEGPDVR